MKNKQLIVNVVLGLAVVILFALQFSGSEETDIPSGAPESPKSTVEVIQEDTTKVVAEAEEENLDSLMQDLMVEKGATSTSTLPVAYVNLDEVQSEFKYYNKKVKRLEAKFKSKSKALEDEQAEIKSKMQSYYMQFQQGEINEEEFNQFQMAIEPQARGLQEKVTKYDREFQQAQMELSLDGNDKIKKFLEDNRQRLKYDLVIGMSQMGTVILYGDEGLDITDQMIKGLNKAYK